MKLYRLTINETIRFEAGINLFLYEPATYFFTRKNDFFKNIIPIL